MEDDFLDDDIEESIAFNSQLVGYQAYQRRNFKPDVSEPLYLMNIDVAASYHKQYFKQKVKTSEGMVEKEFVIKQPLIQIYACTINGDSVCVNIRDFVPYFVVPVPEGMEDTPENLEQLRIGINERMKDCPVAVTKILPMKAMNIRNYRPEYLKNEQKYLRIQAISHAYVPQLRKIFEEGTFIKGVYLPRQTFESNIPYLLRFMIDKSIVGMGWFKINAGYKISAKTTSRCQAEIQAEVALIQDIPCSGQWAKIAPLRVLSFDIECAAEHGFPNAERDAVIQIACVCKSTDKDVEDYKVVFVLNGAAPISGTHVKHMKTQKQLLEDFQKLIITYDPDFLVGYNMINFDLKYLLDRAKALKIQRYGYFGRNLNQLSTAKMGRFQSKQMGMRDTVQINTDGRIQLDMLIHMHNNHKLTSYRLNNVSYMFLGDQKEDVHHSEIYKLHHQSMQSRKRLAEYCLKDAQLPLRLMQKLCCLYNHSEMARVTGVPINFLLKRGQQIKVVSQLLRKARVQGYVMPSERVKNSDSEIGFEGAYVLDPIPGFYEQPIATLDFASLYPSIMRAHNLCYTTLVNKNDLQKYGLGPEDVFITSDNIYFVKKHKKEGLLPQILRELITARKQAKKQLAVATDPMLQKVLDGRQLALKISANSVYGFTGATVGQLPCLQISSTVTLIGRQMIDKTRNLVIEKYGAQVIYGDTDSVMVKFKLESDKSDRTEQIREAMRYGTQAAAEITKYFDDPIKLQFEKVYCPYLLIAKKRYAGVYYTKPQKYDKIDKKGLQTVRRDNCLLIRQMLDKVLKTVLLDNDIDLTISYIKNTISDLLKNKIDISKLVITKAITKGTQEQQDNNKKGEKAKDNKKTYKSKQAHTELAQKMKKRDENVDIHIGDRIPYVMINGAKWSKNYDNAQDPIKVLNEDLPIDYDYYINKQIKPPLQRLLKNSGIISNFDLLFSGEHTRVRYAAKISQSSALGAFITKKPSCINCKRTSNTAVCADCSQQQVDIYMKKKEEYENMLQEQQKMMVECNNCQKFVNNPVICANFDCPIFYKRLKVKKEVEEHEEQLQRFTTTYAW